MSDATAVERGHPPDEPVEPGALQTINLEVAWGLFLGVVRTVWPVALTIAIFRAFGGLGYNPTDDGFVLSWSARLLRGQVPHADFISARPVGSAILHMVDIVLPTPLEPTSRLITLAEITLYTVCLAAIVFGCWQRRWSLWQSATVATAVLVNLHVSPIMPWYTIDGLVLASAGFALLLVGDDPPSPSPAFWGMLLLGCAALVKQSFFAAPIIGVILLVRADPAPWREQVRRLTLPFLAGVVPGFLYIFWVTVAGGLSDFKDQLTGAKSTYGESLFTNFAQPTDSRRLLQHIVMVFLLLTIARTTFRRRTLVGALTSIAARSWLTLIVLDSVRHQHLALGGTWGQELLWTLLAVLAWELWADHKLDIGACIVGGVGYMAMLSWGYAVPNYVAGSIAVAIIARIWRDGLGLPSFAGRVVLVMPIIAALLALQVVSHDFRKMRNAQIYRDAAKPGLTKDLGSISHELRGIRTNPNTYEYLAQIKRCIAEYPASRVAILPDNPGLYPIFHLHNPFPMDWIYYLELVGDAKKRMLAAAQKLSARGDYLVLFETQGHAAQSVAGVPPVPSVPLDAPLFRYSYLEQQIFDALKGERVSCGSFVAVYAAPVKA